MRTKPWLLVAAFAPAMSACYSYVPVEGDVVAPGSVVRARVSAAQADALREVLPVDSRVLEGEVLESGEAGLRLLVPIATRADRGRLETLHQRILLSRESIVELDERRLDRLRTAGLIGAVAVALGAVVASELGGEPGTRPPNSDGPAELVVPVRLRVGGR